MEKSKPCGANPSAARSEPWADCVWAVLTSSDNGRRRLAHAHDNAAAASGPTVSAASTTASCGYKGSALPSSSLFSSSSFAHAPPQLFLVPCRRRPPHLGPLSTASSSSTLRRCTSMTLPAPASTTPPALTTAPPRSMRAAVDSSLQPLLGRIDHTPSTAPPSISSPTALTQPVTPTPACRRLFPTVDTLHCGQASLVSFFLPAAPKLVHHPTAFLPGPSPLHLDTGTTGIRPGRR
jgi:hypothetical protein